MKKKFFAVILTLVLCIAFAGCGGGDDSKKDKKADQDQPTTIVGSWECEDIEITDNGTKLSKDEMKAMMGEDLTSMMKLNAFEDGTMELSMREDTYPATWTEKDGVYTISAPESGTDGSMTAKLKDGRLQVSAEEAYSSDGEEQTMKTTFTLKYLGKTSRIIDGWDVQLSDDEVYAMSNFINKGMYLVSGDMLYGDFGGKEYGKGTFMAGNLKNGKIKDQKVVVKNAKPSYLTEYDGKIYAILDHESIVSVESGKTKAKTVYEGACDYMQVKKDGIYFTDENDKYCRIDLNGKNKETVLDKSVYYPYQLGGQYLIYQNDADGESLHMYNLKSGNDVKLSSDIAYEPMICGDYVYYEIPSEGEDLYYMGRVDLYTGTVEKSEKDMMLYSLYVEPDQITFAGGGIVPLKLGEWDQLPNTSYGGEKVYTMYNNGSISITRSYGEGFLTEGDFSTNSENSIGYGNVKE